MTKRKTLLVTACVLVALAAVLWVAAPSQRLPSSMGSGETPPEQVTLMGIVRDFQESHPDFQVMPSEGAGHYAGLVRTPLGDDGRPVLETGGGRRVLTQATDSAGRPIAPHLANKPCSGVVTDFEIVDGTVVPGQPFAAMVTLLGAAITSSGNDIPVTTEVRIGAESLSPFGPFDDPTAGDVNDDNNPRYHIFPPGDTYPAGTPISVSGRSWLSDDDDGFNVYLSAASNDGSSQVLVLRDGDAVPTIEPYDGQDSIESFVADYIDLTTGTVTLQAHEAIFLFELGTTDLDSAAADFQDLVVLITLATSTDAFTTDGTVIETDNLTDTAAVLSDTTNNGAISSASSFGAWYAERLGVNLSAAVPITLQRTFSGTYVFDDTLDPTYSGLGGFFPIDDRLFGNEGDHNHHFTYGLSARFQYDENADQYLEYTGTGDIWIHVDETLCLDLGGIHGVMGQRIDFERLCLAHGETYVLKLFMAQRYEPTSRVRIETNVVFQTAGVPMVTHQYD